MYYIYILRSKKDSIRTYIGITTNLTGRLLEHNRSKAFHTKRYIPWEIEAYIAIKDKTKAFDFEKYLKSGSGKAFLQKRLVSK